VEAPADSVSDKQLREQNGPGLPNLPYTPIYTSTNHLLDNCSFNNLKITLLSTAAFTEI